MKELSELAKDFVAFFDCDYEYFPKSSYEDLMEKFEDCVKEGKEKGYVPVIVTVDDTLLESFTLNVFDDEEFSLEKVREYRKEYVSKKLEDGKSLLAELVKEKKEEFADDDISWQEIVGEFEDLGNDKLNSPISFLNYQSDEPEELFIVKVPVKNSWEIFAWLPMGAWNDCPDTESLMAISKYWYEQFGASPIAMTHDVLEYEVKKIITDDKLAMNTAIDMYGFCPDINQNFDTIGKFAGTLVDSSVWYFWWD